MPNHNFYKVQYLFLLNFSLKTDINNKSKETPHLSQPNIPISGFDFSLKGGGGAPTRCLDSVCLKSARLRPPVDSSLTMDWPLSSQQQSALSTTTPMMMRLTTTTPTTTTRGGTAAATLQERC
jgi:hypothetical protein